MTASTSVTLNDAEAATIKRMQGRAKAAREMRSTAPVIGVNNKRVVIPQKQQIARAAKDSGGQDGKFHWTHQPKERLDIMVDQGYEPGLDPDTGKWLKFTGDYLMKTLTKDFEKSLQENSAISKAMLGEKMEADAAATGEKVTARTVNVL